MEYTVAQEKQYFDELKASFTQNGTLLYAGRLLQRAAQKYPYSPVLIYKDQEITYQQLYDRVCALVQLLKQKGIKPRDKVLICFENSPEFYIAYYAVWHVGAVVAPLNTFLKEKELAHIIADAQPKLVLTSSDRLDLFKKAETSLPEILTQADMPQTFDGLCDDPIDLNPEELCALLYTSGTTGLPKGVMLSSKNIITNLMQGVSRLRIGHGERLFGALPLFHVFAQNVFVWGAIFMGSTVILVPKIDRKLILEALEHKPTGFLGVPALFGLLCLLKTAPLDSVKYFISGGDALPDKIRSYFELLYRRKICNGYGLTETSPVIAADFSDYAKPTDLVGRPVVGIEIQLRGENGAFVSQGEIGELWVKGDNIMMGYYNAPEQTQKVLKDGWFNTGDTFYLNEDGKLVITGRTKDLIINKGINIYPQEIENVILSHSNVLAAAVVGKEDDQGEVPVAFVQLRQEEPGMQDALMQLCKDQLAAYKVPRQFICSPEELPMTGTRKINKKLLREQLNKRS